MSVEWVKGEVVFTCDACDDTLETGEDNFHAALALFKGEGWRAEKVGSEWIHTCPSCQQDERLEGFRGG